jgi:hypothetical protein
VGGGFVKIFGEKYPLKIGAGGDNFCRNPPGLIFTKPGEH